MEIRGLSQRQREIGDILWQCRSLEQVKACITLWGVDAIIMRDMIIAHHLDEVNETKLAMEVLDKYLR